MGSGGGNVGDSTALAAAIEGESETLKVSVALGAKGGSGGNVGVTNGSSSTCSGCKSETQTYGNDAAGIVAQSIGGGGGKSTAGNANTDSPNFGDKTGDAVNLALSLGAQAGVGGKGGQVTVDLAADNPISTGGSGVVGILAQSIGGGGGNVGGGSSGGSGDKVNLNVSVGGEGGSGNTGGTVEITSGGSICTSGGDSVGILAQSIGELTEQVTGGPSVLTASGRLRAAYQMPFQNWYVAPTWMSTSPTPTPTTIGRVAAAAWPWTWQRRTTPAFRCRR